MRKKKNLREKEMEARKDGRAKMEGEARAEVCGARLTRKRH